MAWGQVDGRGMIRLNPLSRDRVTGFLFDPDSSYDMLSAVDAALDYLTREPVGGNEREITVRTASALASSLGWNRRNGPVEEYRFVYGLARSQVLADSNEAKPA